MGERKVLNKYYSPDFDPAKIPRRRQPKNHQEKVRMMLPMSVRCNTCGNYMYKGTKFNTRIEHADNYLGIKIYRFYSKCTKCSAEFTYKTDPKNSDYAVESGVTRNFEPWREQDEKMEKQKQRRDAEEMGDAMKSLENRTIDSKREMDIVATLDELKSMKSRQATVSVEAMLEALRHTAEEKERKMQEERNALIKSLFKEKREKFVKRIRDDEIEDDDDDEEEDLDIPQKSRESSKRRKLLGRNPTNVLTKSSDRDKAVRKVKVAVVKKKSSPSSSKEIVEEEKLDIEEEEEPTSLKSNGLLSLCQQYESEDDYD
ncbi:PREDICTED: coiled-coil domain-containing protein 94 homolog [Ipomoea nil]|uniref:coiled-coil domain-containing protein 94 homolog n=1 Tax=Ipomoea nil TaxID=35883 RepID=UPI0009017787|nr:PREDICTED: coiled-coil domain-containing protein 94 homolog [Ipomoea nil]